MKRLPRIPAWPSARAWPLEFDGSDIDGFKADNHSLEIGSQQPSQSNLACNENASQLVALVLVHLIFSTTIDYRFAHDTGA
jgi:hypothetical protein